MNVPDRNSKRTRVEPVFGWLPDHGGADWAGELLALAEGIRVTIAPRRVRQSWCREDRTVPASRQRLAWMVRNADKLAPLDPNDLAELRARVGTPTEAEQAAAAIEAGKPIPSRKRLEGDTHADCLIECEHAIIWVEGKRDDWLSPSIRWDSARDQLARNLEAAWLLARESGREFCVLLCYEEVLKPHERDLVEGYRDRTRTAGLPHLGDAERALFAERIGTLRWRDILGRWPQLRALTPLADVGEVAAAEPAARTAIPVPELVSIYRAVKAMRDKEVLAFAEWLIEHPEVVEGWFAHGRTVFESYENVEEAFVGAGRDPLPSTATSIRTGRDVLVALGPNVLVGETALTRLDHEIVPARTTAGAPHHLGIFDDGHWNTPR